MISICFAFFSAGRDFRLQHYHEHNGSTINCPIYYKFESTFDSFYYEGFFHDQLSYSLQNWEHLLQRLFSTINCPLTTKLRALKNLSTTTGMESSFWAWRGPVNRLQAFGPFFTKNRGGALVYFYPCWAQNVGGPGPTGPLRWLHPWTMII